MFSLLCGRDGLTSCFQEKNSRANMAAMAKLWRFISPERIGFFLQKLEVLFASCYSIQNIFLRIFKVTGSGQIKMAQMSHFGTTAWCLSAGCFWLAEALTNTVWNCIIFDVLNVLTWFPITARISSKCNVLQVPQVTGSWICATFCFFHFPLFQKSVKICFG